MKEWVGVVGKYNRPDIRKSIWQIVNSLGPYLLLWYVMYRSLSVSYLLTLALSILAAGFLVRIFIIFHDCGHGSFFRSSRANRIVGTLLGSLVFTPYEFWTNDHAMHHRTVGNLDKRGWGDIWTVTTEEYKQMSRPRRFRYRLYRHPVILFLIGPFIFFVLFYRIPRKKMNKKERQGIHLTNLIILIWCASMILLMGWKAFLLIQLPVIYFATTAGAWLFYIQHQFDQVIWARSADWDYQQMALEGSSYVKFPRILQWFSGNIGFHHIHHLSPKIPNYNLEKCQKENDLFQQIKPMKFVESLKTMRFRLWDEESRKLITFRHYREAY